MKKFIVFAGFIAILNLTPAAVSAQVVPPEDGQAAQPEPDMSHESPVMVMEMPEEAPPKPVAPEEPAPKSAQQLTDEAYLKMVQESYAMNADFDFEKARDLYTRTSFYEPVLANPRKSFEEYLGRLHAKSNVVAKEVQAYMYHNFALPEAHSRAAIFFRKAGMAKAVVYHDWAAKGLVKAIRSSGNATSAEKAMKVVIISEQYLVTESWGAIADKETKQVGDRVYDILSIENEETGEQRKAWFDVTALNDFRRRKQMAETEAAEAEAAAAAAAAAAENAAE